MSERLFVFIQAELPFALGLADGRYVLRERAGAEPEHVPVVRSTTGAHGARPRRRSWRRLRRGRPERAWRGRAVSPHPDPAPRRGARATVIDPVSLSAKRQAQAWLEAIDPEQEILAAFAVLNRALFAHRIAGADPAVHAIAPAEAIAIRAGWGLGEQVADGHWSHARELHWADPRPRRRVAALRPQERFAALLGGHTRALMCEELALRARADLEHGRPRPAALELEQAYAAALAELRADETPAREARGRRPTFAQRLSELERLNGGVVAAAAAARRHATGSQRAIDVDEEVLRHALSRLEAALRARAAAS
jgi:hypothetical protein